MVGFYWLDPRSGQYIQTGNTRVFFSHDFTWQGIRKGGERFHTFAFFSGAFRLFSQREDLNDFLQSPQPPIGLNTVQGNAQPRGMTNIKKDLALITQDSTGAFGDRLQYNDLNGNLLSDHALSDNPIQRVHQIVSLEHDFYVIKNAGGDEPDGAVAVYGSDGSFIRQWLLPGTPPEFPDPIYRGITTDGKHLYVNRVDTPSEATLKFDVYGNLLRTYTVPVGLGNRWPISFNGRYLLVQLFNAGPG